MDFEVFVLGTSGMMPLPGRALTSACVRRDGDLYLFDCGEGTQISLKKLSIHWKKIHSIFISHMHADHVTGLPGILMLSSQVDRTEPLYIYGPPQLADYIESSRRTLDMYINYEIKLIPVSGEETIIDTPEYQVRTFPLEHTKPCQGYSMIEKPRSGEFFPDRAKALGVPMGPLWGALQRGESVEVEGKTIHPSDVLGPPRKGRKFTYITDTMYFPEMANYAYGSDLLVIEGMFEGSLKRDAKEKKHLLCTQAATVAKDAEAKQVALVHYSPRYSNAQIKDLEREAQEIYPPVIAARDRMQFTLALDS